MINIDKAIKVLEDAEDADYNNESYNFLKRHVIAAFRALGEEDAPNASEFLVDDIVGYRGKKGRVIVVESWRGTAGQGLGDIKGESFLGVEFQEEVSSGHSCSGRGKHRFCLWLRPERLTLIYRRPGRD